MRFQVIPPRSRPTPEPNKAVLIGDAWNDWHTFVTQFYLVVFDENGAQHDIGNVKIGEVEMQAGQMSPRIPTTFEQIGEQFFSLGQEEDYYDALNRLGDDTRMRLLAALRDVAADLALFDRVLPLAVTQQSLLRFVNEVTVRTRFARLARGDARLSPYDFRYDRPAHRSALGTGGEGLRLTFRVTPNSLPPSNVHVLIGRNGVGKTTLLQGMSAAALNASPEGGGVGTLESADGRSAAETFANLVAVSFSAFDVFYPPSTQPPGGLRYSYIGLQRPLDESGRPRPPKGHEDLVGDFLHAATACLKGVKAARWRRALRILESDPLFKDHDIVSFANGDRSDLPPDAADIFRELSSGHKIVLLTVTALVAEVGERTLVLIDEPEAHLHPPLLSALIRAISELLAQRNGVAIIATHSPVVLQEVPRECVWRLMRVGTTARAERLATETFGEGVGVLTREVFGHEVTASGFHTLIMEQMESFGSYDWVMAEFDDAIGGEGRSMLRAREAELRSERVE